MASLTFVMNDSSTGGNNPKVEVTITENPDGSLSFSLRQLQSAGAYIGDLRGFFFDLPDSQESALAGASVTNQIKNPDGSGTGTAAQNAAAVMGNDSVMSAGGNSNNMNGLSSGGNGYDFGLEIGSEGVGRGGDDVRSFSFTLAPAANKTLSLSDFANATFGVRVMSVGQDTDGNGSIDTARNGSSKIAETTFTYVTAVNDDTGCVDENASPATGNIFTNDTGKTALDVMTVTGWDTDGNAGNGVLTVGATYEIVDDAGDNAGDDAAGATVRLNADGSWVVDASAADALSEGEHIEQTFTVNVKQDHYVDGAHLNLDGTYTTTETFTVEVCGVNDGPVANDDDFTGEDGDNCIPEAGTFTNNVLTNDTDIDRLDTISVTGIRDGDGNLILLDQGVGDTDGADTATVTLASGAQVTIHSDGSFSYDTNHKFDAMVDGDMREDSFVYELSDNHGGTDEATATVCIDGEGDNGGGGGGGGGNLNTPPDAVDDTLECVTQLDAATTGVSGNVLDNDSDPNDDPLLVTSVNGVAIDFDDNGVEHIALANGTLDIEADGDFVFHYTGAYSATELHPKFDYTISDGRGGTDSASVTLCLDPLDDPGRGSALSPGAWSNNFDLTDSENLPAGLLSGATTLDDFFGLDDGTGPVTNRTWTVGGNLTQDLTLDQAMVQTGNPATSPNLTGNENALARQAAAVLADYFDDDGHDDFVAAYIYQRAINDNNGTLADNPYDSASVLADLTLQVHNAFEGITGAYAIDTLTHILDFSHEA